MACPCGLCAMDFNWEPPPCSDHFAPCSYGPATLLTGFWGATEPAPHVHPHPGSVFQTEHIKGLRVGFGQTTGGWFARRAPASPCVAGEDNWAQAQLSIPRTHSYTIISTTPSLLSFLFISFIAQESRGWGHITDSSTLSSCLILRKPLQFKGEPLSPW